MTKYLMLIFLVLNVIGGASAQVPTAPPAPSVAFDLGYQRPVVSWPAVSGAVSYTVYRDNVSLGNTRLTHLIVSGAVAGRTNTYTFTYYSTATSAMSLGTTFTVPDTYKPSVYLASGSVTNTGVFVSNMIVDYGIPAILIALAVLGWLFARRLARGSM